MERSIFMVGTYYPANPYFAAVVKYDLNKLTRTDCPRFECVARLDPGDKLNNRIVWRACSLSNECTALCLLPAYLYNTVNVSDASEIKENVALNGYIYDMKTVKVLKTFKAPTATKFLGLVFCLEGKIYCIADPCYTNILPEPSFEQYDPDEEIWKPLTPFPWDNIFDEEILGYGVFEDFVLFNVNTRGLWAYDVRTDKWYEVTVHNPPHYFQGLGVIVENKTLYALKECKHDSILLILSITKEQTNDDDLKFSSSLQSEICLPDRNCGFKAREWDKDVLVHLGNKEFCLVRNGLLDEGYDYQLLQLVLFKLDQVKGVEIVEFLEHRVEVCDYAKFCPIFGFSLPALDSLHFVEKKYGDIGFDITLDPIFQEAVQESENEDVADTTNAEVQTIMNSYESVEYADPSSVVHNTITQEIQRITSSLLSRPNNPLWEYRPPVNSILKSKSTSSLVSEVSLPATFESFSKPRQKLAMSLSLKLIPEKLTPDSIWSEPYRSLPDSIWSGPYRSLRVTPSRVSEVSLPATLESFSKPRQKVASSLDLKLIPEKLTPDTGPNFDTRPISSHCKIM